MRNGLLSGECVCDNMHMFDCKANEIICLAHIHNLPCLCRKRILLERLVIFFLQLILIVKAKTFSLAGIF